LYKRTGWFFSLKDQKSTKIIRKNRFSFLINNCIRFVRPGGLPRNQEDSGRVSFKGKHRLLLWKSGSGFILTLLQEVEILTMILFLLPDILLGIDTSSRPVSGTLYGSNDKVTFDLVEHRSRTAGAMEAFRRMV